jgi:hypothetical protein
MESKVPEIKPPFRSQIVEHYSRPDILDEMLRMAKDREFVGAYKDGSYQKRPNIVQFPSDIIQMARNNATSFHCSVERWKNPMQLSTQAKNYADLRKGFDFLIDIDSKTGLESSKICASLICKFLRGYGIRNYGIKFSGRRGFHIIIPCEAFPEEVDYAKTRDSYPRIPVVISDFIRENIRGDLLRELVRKHTAKKLSEMVPNDSMDPYNWVEVEKGWGERHLFRAPYSFNEKTWLVSIPVRDPMEFDIGSADIDKVKTRERFLKPCEKDEALQLLMDAMNWSAKREKMKAPEAAKRVMDMPTEKISEEHFPPCIRNILKGLEDGKKRSVFTLINFLRMMNWSWEDIETKIMEWNVKNPKPLPASFIMGQINWNKHQKKVFPARCDNVLFYKSIDICSPDSVCGKIKNPVAYPFKKPGAISLKKGKAGSGFMCRLCSKAFKSEQSLRTHQARSHGDYLTE